MAAVEPHRIALVLSGVSGPELAASNRDVTEVYGRLTDPKIGGCVPKQPKPICGCAGVSTFWTALDDVIEHWQPADQLILYFSGHGRYLRSVYCLAFGERDRDYIPFTHIYERIQLAGVTRAILIVDACYSGAAAGLKEGLEGARVDAPDFPEESIPSGFAIIASCGPRQRSSEIEDGAVSVFTRLFCDGLDTGLDSKATTDGLIGVTDMVGYINDRLEREPEFKEYPQRSVTSVRGADRTIWLAKGKRTASGLAPEHAHATVDARELEILYDRLPKDRLPCEGTGPDVLDWDLVSEYVKRYRPELLDADRRALLSELKLNSAIPVLGRTVLHRAAVLSFARWPQEFLSNAWAGFRDETTGGQSDGEDRFEIERIGGPIVRQSQELLRLVRSRLRRISRISDSGERVEEDEIDQRLIRELLSNALVHRDYQVSSHVDVRVCRDFLEIRSPGRLPMPWDEILKAPEASMQVNATLANYQYTFRWFEGRGTGFRRIREYLEKHGPESIEYSEIPLGPATLIRVRRPIPPAPPQKAIGHGTESTAADEGGNSAVLAAWETKFLRARLDKWAKGSYGGLQARAGRRQLDRSTLYVSLRALAEPSCWADENEQLVVEGRRAVGGRSGAGEKRRGPFLERILSYPGFPLLAIEGEAGSGKTALLQHVAYALACRHLNEPSPLSQLNEAELSAGAPLLRIPILLEAKHLADFLRAGELGELTEALTQVLRKTVDEPAISVDTVREGLRAGRYLLLVDSLDEVPSAEARRRVFDCLCAFCAGTDWRSRLVLTSRPMAHTGVSLSGAPLRLFRIAPLESDQMVQMVARWVRVIGEGADYEERLEHAISELERRHPPGAEERSIPQNPQLLTCSFLVFDQQRLLPDSPAALFERMVQLLCDAKPSPRLPAETKRRLLERVFEDIQRSGGTEKDARRVAEALVGTQPGLDTIDKALELLDQVASETGLLCFEERQGPNGEEQKVARPWHRSFEEYLCACRLASAAASVDEETDRLVGYANEPGVLIDETWEGVMTFLFGVHLERGTERAQAYLRRLLWHARCERGSLASERRGRILGVAARGLAENPQVEIAAAVRDQLRQEIAHRFAEEGAKWPLHDRLLALEALGRLGDPRLDGELWVDIPGGTYSIGGDEQAYQSLPAQRVAIEAFRLMWRPVTVLDFRAFVDAGGYAVDDWWKAGRPEGEVREPDGWQSQLYHPSRPVTGVSWYEAQAFCRWASKVWGGALDLPSEVEWESAARGPEATIFPWGTEKVRAGDTAEASHSSLVGHPSPVGAFPLGNRGRLADLAGNVWEWCTDVWTEDGQSPFNSTSSRDSRRVARGGSWSFGPEFLRCTNRNVFFPGIRSGDLGFRLVWRGFPEN